MYELISFSHWKHLFKLCYIIPMRLEYILLSVSVLLFVLPILFFIHWRIPKIWHAIWISLLVVFLMWILLMLHILGQYIFYAVYFLPFLIIGLVVLTPISWMMGSWVQVLKPKLNVSRQRVLYTFVATFLLGWAISGLLFWIASAHQQQRIQENWQKLPTCTATITHNCKG